MALFNKILERQRSIATYSYMFYGFLIALDYSSTIISQLYYLKDTVNVSSPEHYYSVITTSMAVGGAFSGIVIGRYTDLTRNLKTILAFLSVVSFIGSLLYTIHFSVWYLVVGRFLCGLNDAAQVAITGEFSRLYSAEEMSNILSKYQGFYALGFVLGPFLSVLSNPVDLRISSLQLNQANFPSVILSFLFLCFFPWTMFLKFLEKKSQSANGPGKEIRQDDVETESKENLIRKENVMKEEIMIIKCNEDVVIEIEKENAFFVPQASHEEKKQIPVSQRSEALLTQKKHDATVIKFCFAINYLKMTLRRIFYNVDAGLLIVSTSICNFVDININLSTAMVVSNLYKWNLTRISLIASICMLLYTCVSLFLGRRIIKKSTVHHLYLVTFVTLVIPISIIIVEKTVYIESEWMQIFLVSLTFLIATFCGMQVIVLGRKLLFQVIPSKSASLYEGIRNSVSRVFAILAYFTSVWIYLYAEFVLSAVITVIILFALVFCIRNHCKRSL